MQNGTHAGGSIVPKNKYLLVIALGTLVVGTLQAFDAVELPFGTLFSWIGGSVLSSSTLTAFMTNYGYASVFALMALESASLPIPSEVVLPLAGYFVRQGALDFWAVVAVSTVASITGALADYFLAKWLGRPFVLGILRFFRIHRDALDRAEAWFARSAQWTVLAARFVPGLRTIISLPAGLFEMDIWKFLVMTVAGCFAWSVILVYAGTLVSSASTSTFFTSSTAIDALSGLIAAMSAVYVGYYAYTSRRGPSPIPSSSVS